MDLAKKAKREKINNSFPFFLKKNDIAILKKNNVFKSFEKNNIIFLKRIKNSLLNIKNTFQMLLNKLIK